LPKAREVGVRVTTGVALVKLHVWAAAD